MACTADACEDEVALLISSFKSFSISSLEQPAKSFKIFTSLTFCEPEIVSSNKPLGEVSLMTIASKRFFVSVIVFLSSRIFLRSNIIIPLLYKFLPGGGILKRFQFFL